MPSQFRHFQVGHDHVEPLALQSPKGFLAVPGGNHFVTLCGQIVSLDKANELGLTVLDEAGFLELLEETGDGE